MAKLTATVLNMMGGKPKGPSTGEPIIAYHPHELMPPYAHLEDMIFHSLGIAETTAKQFLALSEKRLLPGWVIQTADIAQIRIAAGRKP